MWEPQPLTILRASKACRGENFTFTWKNESWMSNRKQKWYPFPLGQMIPTTSWITITQFKWPYMGTLWKWKSMISGLFLAWATREHLPREDKNQADGREKLYCIALYCIVLYWIATLILRRNFVGGGVLSKPWVSMKGPMFSASQWLLYSCE
jgi:hypothetical protein